MSYLTYISWGSVKLQRYYMENKLLREILNEEWIFDKSLNPLTMTEDLAGRIIIPCVTVSS